MGIDIVEIEELKVSIEKSKRFLERVFTPQEISYCESKSNKFASYSARFAAKEAVMKALGTGWDMGVQWKQIEVTHGDWSPETGDREEVNGDWFTVNGEDGKWYSEIGNQYLDTSISSPMLNAHNGKPEIELTGKALKLSKEMGVVNIFLSLSHSKCNAVASVIFEGDRKPKTGDRRRETGVRSQEPTANS